MHIPKELLNKYNKPVPRYTSYPPANYFETGFSQQDFITEIKKSNSEKPENLSFYIHIPFCDSLCFYCGCNTKIGEGKNVKTSYVEAVKAEILMFRQQLDKSRKISQIHWGGGTPNSIDVKYIQEIMQLFFEHFDFTPEAEIAMECNPAYLTTDYINSLRDLKFNRLSLGIQDFNPDVLKAVNRQLPLREPKKIVEYIRNNSDIKVNIDLIYGLPYQSPESFAENIRKAIEIRPERLVTFSYAHVPWIKPAQKKLEKIGLPSPKNKIKMYETAYTMLTENGEYDAIGLDHFALKNDELSIALRKKRLHRNFQGYCTRETTGQVYAIGISGISQLHSAYIQSTKDIPTYIQSIEKGKFAPEKAYRLNPSEIAIRESITQLMCNLEINWEETARHLGMAAKELTNTLALSPEKIKEFADDGIIVHSSEGIKITEKGQFFIRNIAAALDPLTGKGGKSFSKAV